MNKVQLVIAGGIQNKMKAFVTEPQELQESLKSVLLNMLSSTALRMIQREMLRET